MFNKSMSKKKKEKLIISFFLRNLSLISVLMYILVYEFLASVGIINSTVLSKPSEIFSILINIKFLKFLTPHLVSSLSRVLLAYLLGVSLGYVVGLLMSINPFLNKLLKPLLALQFIAPISLFPAIILIFGIGEIGKIIILAYSIFFPVLLSTIEGFNKVNSETIEIYKVMGASKSLIIREILIYASLPYVFIGINISLIPAFVVLISAEMLGGSNGLGYLILLFQRTFQVHKMYACVVIVMILAFLIYNLFKIIQRQIIHWISIRASEY